MYTRREALLGAGTLGAAALAGCSGGGGGGSDAVPLGESQTVGGIQITVQSVTTLDTISLVAQEGEGGNGTATTTGTTAAGTTPVTTQFAGEDSDYVVAFVRFENTSEETQDLPHPGVNNPPAAAGDLFISGPAQSVSLLFPNGDLVWEDEVHDGLGEVVADHNWSLASGESLSGWILFSVPAQLNVGDMFLSVDVDQGGTARFALS